MNILDQVVKAVRHEDQHPSFNKTYLRCRGAAADDEARSQCAKGFEAGRRLHVIQCQEPFFITFQDSLPLLAAHHPSNCMHLLSTM